jgi:hypothetical protein
MILLANLFVLKSAPTRLVWHYAGLFAILAAATIVPLEAFLGGGVLLRYVAPCALALGPMFFAGVIFAKTFRDSPDADMAFGSNIAASVLGGSANPSRCCSASDTFCCLRSASICCRHSPPSPAPESRAEKDPSRIRRTTAQVEDRLAIAGLRHLPRDERASPPLRFLFAIQGSA